jgi:hypothetical protein
MICTVDELLTIPYQRVYGTRKAIARLQSKPGSKHWYLSTPKIFDQKHRKILRIFIGQI